jgi:hypothetical protein
MFRCRIITVKWCLKGRIAEPDEMAVAGNWHKTHFSAAKDSREVVFSAKSVRGLTARMDYVNTVSQGHIRSGSLTIVRSKTKSFCKDL